MLTFNNLFSVKISDLPVFISISICTLSFLIYWTLFSLSKGNGKDVIRARFAGFFLMGIIPTGIIILISDLWFDDLGLIPVRGSVLFIVLSSIILSLLGILVTLLNPGVPKHFRKYPQIRNHEWSQSLFIMNLISWAIYLTGYEIMFRGIIIFTLLKTTDIWTAVLISTALYSALHLQKGLFEAFGAILLGMLLSVFTIISGSIWIAVIVHIVLAVSNTLWSFKRHPDMILVKNTVKSSSKICKYQ